jgi:RNA polymerase sigma-70 factor (ECF subfamily)
MVLAAAPGLDLAILSLRSEDERLGPPLTGEAAFALAAARGDRQAFGRLVDLHKRAVHGLCLRLLRDPEDARDAAQETFARAYAALKTFDPAQPFAPWVLRIARNHCLDALRRRGAEGRPVSLDADPEDGQGSFVRELADPDATRADDAIERRQLAGSLSEAVAALPDNYREVVHLFHVDHLSYKEIAATMEVPMGTVMTWLHRARRQLREALSEPGAEATP